MAGRYAEHKLMSYCFHPRTILRDGELFTVPCGKCDGCLLHKANLWSARLSQEIDSNPYSIFGTLTYSNKFIPTLKHVAGRSKGAYWFSDHNENVRYNGKKIVLREDHISVYDSRTSYNIQNDSRTGVINYASKRDIQLWLKLIKKDLTENFYETGHFFRYFVVSEVGPTTLRNHYHFVILPNSFEVAEYLLHTSLYKNWQMCDETLFKLYCSYCDSGTASYVGNYVNSINRLPSIYRHPELKPFRLSSKSPAIGFGSYDPSQIEESYITGDGTYSRVIREAGENHLLCYSSEYLRSVFPKCYRFSELSASRLLYVYGYLYRAIIGTGLPYLSLSSRLCALYHQSDWLAMRKCYEYCQKYGCTPFHYLYVLDLIYYKSAMRALKMQYEFLEKHKANFMACLSLYYNLMDYIQNRHFLSDSERLMLEYFLESYHIYDIDSLDSSQFVYNDPDLDAYINEVSDIVDGLQKMPKYNEMRGNAPHIV